MHDVQFYDVKKLNTLVNMKSQKMSSVHGSSVTLIRDTRFVINNVSVSLVPDYLRLFSCLDQNNSYVINC